MYSLVNIRCRLFIFVGRFADVFSNNIGDSDGSFFSKVINIVLSCLCV